MGTSFATLVEDGTKETQFFAKLKTGGKREENFVKVA